MNKYHTNINVTFEANPSKFLECFTYHKEMKLPFHWMSAVPKHYKKNVITGELHRIKYLSSNFEQDVGIITNKYIKAGYPFCFSKSIIDDFNREKEDPLILTSLLEERREVSFQIPF